MFFLHVIGYSRSTFLVLHGQNLRVIHDTKYVTETYFVVKNRSRSLLAQILEIIHKRMSEDYLV